LVVTLALMILLTVIAVGLLSLSTISLRASGQTTARSTAEANARLALMLALGEVQQLLGPDQNVTAPAAIFDAEPESDEVGGVNHPHLTGVWQARGETLAQTPDYSRETSFRRWLVSHTSEAQIKLPEFVRQGALANPVSMVDASNHPAEGRVRAGRLPVTGGALAWWVGDENRKALINPRNDADRKSSAQTAELLAGFSTPGAHGVLLLDGLGEFPANTAASDKLITLETLPLVATADAAKLFHHLSPYPRSVLANVTAGGLRKDLSLYLERGDMHRRQRANQQDLPVSAILNTTPAIDPVANPAWNSGVTRITPMVVRIQMLVSFGVQRQSPTSNNYAMRLYSYPAVTLWNPYNVPMKVAEWSAFLHTLPLEHGVFKAGAKHNLTGGGTLNGNYNWGWPHGNMTLRVGGSTGPGLTFAPGEAKTLTYSSSESGGFNAHNMIETPPAWLPTRAGQPRDLGTISGNPGDRIAISTSLATWGKPRWRRRKVRSSAATEPSARCVRWLRIFSAGTNRCRSPLTSHTTCRNRLPPTRSICSSTGKVRHPPPTSSPPRN
jgi:hypothetical protein